VVRKIQSKESGQVFALKTILKSKVPDLSLLEKEVDLLRQIHHPHVVQLFEVYEEPKQLHLVTELCTGGELYDKVVEKSLEGGHLSEYDVARILRNILEAIAYCHAQGICHRDLKVENFLLLSPDNEAPVKIIDFGLSRKTTDDAMTTKVGTVYYVAPEVLTQATYTQKCDIWSIGVIAYVLLCGFPPFYDKSEVQTLKLVKTAQVEFPSPSWDDVSMEAKQFVLRLLDRNVDSRPSATEALQDSWLCRPQVQPHGMVRHASFRTASVGAHQGTTAGLTKHINQPAIVPVHHHTHDQHKNNIFMKSPQRLGFHNFLQRIKLMKTH
jgi:calcium-dependent protein kinase